ncbi:MAG: hypothetical protein RSA12_05285 [Clostridia bacterium]
MKGVRVSEPLKAKFDAMSLEQFGVLLMGKVYQELSAYVLIDPAGEVTALKLFDTSHAPEMLGRVRPTNRTVALFSNHPTGNMTPTADDLRNRRLLLGAELYLVCETCCVRYETDRRPVV